MIDPIRARIDCSAVVNVQSDGPITVVIHGCLQGDIDVAPKTTIEVHTGPGRNGQGKYYWGRKRAVWNNDGDFVFLINPDRILSYCYLYLPKAKLAIEGPGGIQARFDFQGARKDDAASMLTVTLSNDINGDAYR